MLFFKKYNRIFFIFLLFIICIWLYGNSNREKFLHKNSGVYKNLKQEILPHKIYSAFNSLANIFSAQKDIVLAAMMAEEKVSSLKDPHFMSDQASSIVALQEIKENEEEAQNEGNKISQQKDKGKDNSPGAFKEDLSRDLPEGVLGEEYCVYLNPLWGQGPYTWEVSSGGLPDGMTLDSFNGMYCGQPAKAGIWSFTIKIKDASQNFIFVSYSQTILNFKPEQSLGNLSISCPDPTTVIGVDYTAQLLVTGGKLPCVWSISGLPLGLNFDSSFGLISGTPSESGEFLLNIAVTDQDSKQAFLACPLTIKASPLFLTSNQCPDCFVGENYSCSMQAQGGQPPYTWQVIAGVIPGDLTFDTQTTKITGICTEEGTHTFRVQVKDDLGDTQTADLKITILPANLEIIDQEAWGGDVGENFYKIIKAQGGTPPYTWAITQGILSANIQFQDQGTEGAVLVGVPLDPFEGVLSFQVTDDKIKTGTKDFQLTIKAPSLEITGPASPLQGEVGTNWIIFFEAHGGDPFKEEPSYRWSIKSGELPDGLNLGEDGILTGISAVPYRDHISVAVTDEQGTRSSKEYEMIIEGDPLEITTEKLPCGQYLKEYDFPLEAEGGVPPYLWEIEGLPEDLSVISGNVISGIPQAAGTSNVHMEVKDSLENKDAKDLPLTIIKEVEITSGISLPGGKVNNAYHFVFAAEGGDGGPLRWSIVSGGIPGLTLDEEQGILSGTPTTPGDFSLTIEARDQIEGCEEFPQTSDAKEFSLHIEGISKVNIKPTKCPEGQVGKEYECLLEAEGGVTPYIWDISSGQLPQDLTLETLTTYQGKISGILKEDGEFTFIVRVRDDLNQEDQETITLKVEKEPSACGPVTNFIARGSNSKIGLYWQNPNCSDFDHTEIYRGTSNFPQNPEEGTQVYSGTSNNMVDPNLENDILYYYSAFAFDKDDNFSSLNDDSKDSATPHAVSLNGPCQPYIDEVIAYDPLDPSNAYGSFNLPGVVLGPPKGGNGVQPPEDREWEGSLDVVSLHAKVNSDGGVSGPYGGTIIVRFTDNIVVNGSGVDFTIFENAFKVYGKNGYWMEPAVVDVSCDGKAYYRFPFDFAPYYDGDELNLNSPYTYAEGFAGVKPVYSYNGSPDPTNPAVSGGDSFDLDKISKDLTWIQYVKITSTGDNWLRDMNGDYVRHSNEGDTAGANGTGNSGFDLDAVCAVNY